jgi:hypothetical protein
MAIVKISHAPLPLIEDSSLLAWDMKCRFYKDIKHSWMTRVFLYACMTTPAVSLIEREFYLHSPIPLCRIMHD